MVCADHKHLARRSGDHHTSARDAADYSPADAGLTSRVSVDPTLYRDGFSQIQPIPNKWDNSYPYYERDEELLGQQTGQFLGRF